MSLSQSEIKPLLTRALLHYERRLKETQTDQDVLKLGIDLIKDDLQSNVRDSEHTRKFLDNILKDGSIPIEDKKVMCLALSCYILDLKTTVESTTDKLGKLNLEFKEITNEIARADELRNRICPSD